MEGTKLMLCGIAAGIKDAICGTFVVFQLDRIQKFSGKTSKTTELELLAQRFSSQANRVKGHKTDEPRVLSRIAQCCLLNGVVFWLSIAMFHGFFLPGLQGTLETIFGHSHGIAQDVWSWTKPILSYTFNALWVVPLFLLSKVVNSLWFQDIADSAYKHTRGKPHFFPGLSKLLADTLFSVLIQALFLVQGMLVGLLPILPVGQVVSLIHMCLLYSLYSFEYKWFNMGWELHKRLSFIETNWPYFVGFGLPLAILTAIPSSYVVSGCVFSILFPLFIISGNEAQPMTGTCDFPLQLFTPVVCLSNIIFQQTISSRKNNGQLQVIRPSPEHKSHTS